MKTRNFSEVIQDMIDKIPQDEVCFLNRLKEDMEDAFIKAPEETVQWHRVSETLQTHISNPNKDWHFEVLSIFTTKTIDELKEIIQ